VNGINMATLKEVLKLRKLSKKYSHALRQPSLLELVQVILLTTLCL
jgi:hypothetical protein